MTQALRIIDTEAVEIGIEQDQRRKVAQQISKFLSSTSLLNTKTQYYHWNVTGRDFNSLHNLFEEQYQDLRSAADEIAERTRALGYFTPGTFSEFLRLSELSEDKQIPKNAEQMVENLMRDHESCSRQAKEVLKIAEAADDEATADLMVERMRVHDKAAWMLRSYLQ